MENMGRPLADMPPISTAQWLDCSPLTDRKMVQASESLVSGWKVLMADIEVDFFSGISRARTQALVLNE